MFKGVAGSEGIGIGKVVLIKQSELKYEQNSHLVVDDEIVRLDNAVSDFIQKTTKMADEMRKNIGEKEAEILEGHIMMLDDPSMIDEIKNRISEGMTSEAAADEVFETFATIFEGTGDELTMARATDCRDIKTRLIKILLGIDEVNISSLPKYSVIVASDLTPSMTAGIDKNNVCGIITELGGKTSHSAILARALEISAVLSVENVTDALKNGDSVIVDGILGEVIVDPSEQEISEYSDKKQKFDQQKKELLKFVGIPTKTADGTSVELVCNIGKPADCAAVLDRDGEGVGLFRTEFLYMDSSSLPTEDEQFDAYKKVAMTLNGKPVIIRTLDVGGDKDIPYLNLTKEENPFLGFRAVRYCINNPDIYKGQLRALLRASAFGDVKIMIPLVTCVEEVRTVKSLIKEIMSELDSKNIEYNKDIKIGVMMETPAASVIADLLAKESDFFSIGTNDLTGYTMAVDRGNAKVSYLYSTLNPAVLRSIKRIIECGKNENIMVGMCGEAAADPLLTPLLISFGLSEFSVSPTSVLSTRSNIAKWTKADADKVADEALSCATEQEVESVLAKHKR